MADKMTDKGDKLFKKVWTFNGILLSICLLLGAFGVVFGLSQSFFSPNVIPGNEIAIANSDEKIEFSYGPLTDIGITDYAYSLLTSSKVTSSDSARYSKYAPDNRPIVNILFVHKAHAGSKWLFDNSNQLIIKYDELVWNYVDIKSTAAGQKAPAPNSAAFLYEVIKADTNKDGVLNNKDKIVVASSNVDGNNYVELREVEKVIDTRQLTNSSFSVTYKNGNKLVTEIFSMNSMKSTNKGEVKYF